jgi:hypothetical protein
MIFDENKKIELDVSSALGINNNLEEIKEQEYVR